MLVSRQLPLSLAGVRQDQALGEKSDHRVAERIGRSLE